VGNQRAAVRGPVVSAAEAGRLISEDSNLRMAESKFATR
jgi:hypothetical protein